MVCGLAHGSFTRPRSCSMASVATTAMEVTRTQTRKVLVNPNGRETPLRLLNQPDKTTVPYTRTSSGETVTTPQPVGLPGLTGQLSASMIYKEPARTFQIWGRYPPKDFSQAGPRVKFCAIQFASGPHFMSVSLLKRPAWERALKHCAVYGCIDRCSFRTQASSPK